MIPPNVESNGIQTVGDVSMRVLTYTGPGHGSGGTFMVPTDASDNEIRTALTMHISRHTPREWWNCERHVPVGLVWLKVGKSPEFIHGVTPLGVEAGGKLHTWEAIRKAAGVWTRDCINFQPCEVGYTVNERASAPITGEKEAAPDERDAALAAMRNAIMMRVNSHAGVAHESILSDVENLAAQRNEWALAHLHSLRAALATNAGAAFLERLKAAEAAVAGHEEAINEEQARWQRRIDEIIAQFVPDVDGSGCDSGDPLDLTATEIELALGKLSDEMEALKEERDNLKTANTQLHAACGDLQAKLTNAEGELDTLKGELVYRKQCAEQSQREYQEWKDLQDDHRKLQRELSEMTEARNAMANERDAAREAIKAATSELLRSAPFDDAKEVA